MLDKIEILSKVALNTITQTLSYLNCDFFYLIKAAIGAWVLYISTDYVFDGKSPPYPEDSTPNPLNRYGQSKFEGEQVTMEVSRGI